jgi:hypothetical protein
MPGSMSYGETHGKQLEDERRKIRELAERIEILVNAADRDPWRMAAPAEINGRLVALLPEPLRERLVLNLHADLTKLTLSEIEDRFMRKCV